MSALLSRSIAAAGVVLALHATGVAAQQPFPHAPHDALFPLCGGCHRVDGGPDEIYPPADLCGRCHDGSQAPRVSWSPPETRDAYRHTAHGPDSDVPLECDRCHGGEGELMAVKAGGGCDDCHDAHHDEAARCRLCHTPSPMAAHTRAAHAGCGGDGCHASAVADGLAFTRELCLVCHQELVDHEPGEYCGSCHAVDAAGSGGRALRRPGTRR